MTLIEMADITVEMSDLWPNAPLAPGSERGYHRLLADCPAWIVSVSLPAIARVQPRFPPTPGELLGYVTAKPGERPDPRDLPRLIAEGICTPDGQWAKADAVPIGGAE